MDDDDFDVLYMNTDFNLRTNNRNQLNDLLEDDYNINASFDYELKLKNLENELLKKKVVLEKVESKSNMNENVFKFGYTQNNENMFANHFKDEEEDSRIEKKTIDTSSRKKSVTPPHFDKKKCYNSNKKQPLIKKDFTNITDRNNKEYIKQSSNTKNPHNDTNRNNFHFPCNHGKKKVDEKSTITSKKTIQEKDGPKKIEHLIKNYKNKDEIIKSLTNEYLILYKKYTIKKKILKDEINDLNFQLNQMKYNTIQKLDCSFIEMDQKKFHDNKKIDFIEELNKERNTYINVSNDYTVPRFKSFISIIKTFGYDIDNFYNVEENVLLNNKFLVEDQCDCTFNTKLASDKIHTCNENYWNFKVALRAYPQFKLNIEILQRKKTEKKANEFFSRDLLNLKMLDKQVKLLEKGIEIKSVLKEENVESEL